MPFLLLSVERGRCGYCCDPMLIDSSPLLLVGSNQSLVLLRLFAVVPVNRTNADFTDANLTLNGKDTEPAVPAAKAILVFATVCVFISNGPRLLT